MSTAASHATSAAQSASEAAKSVAEAAGSVSAAASHATSAAQSASEASASASAAKTSETNAASSASAAKTSETNAAASATVAQNAVNNFGLEAGTTTTGDPGTNAEVEIVKDGTRYRANFTIPRGDRGEPGASGINSVFTDNTLTGDGTSSNPLKVSQGAANNQFTELANDANLSDKNINDLNVEGFYGISCAVGTVAPKNVPNRVVSNTAIRATLLVLRNGFPDNPAAVTQFWFNRGADPIDIFMAQRSLRNGVWTEWQYIALDSKFDSYTPLTTTTALDTRVKALETNPQFWTFRMANDDDEAKQLSEQYPSDLIFVPEATI